MGKTTQRTQRETQVCRKFETVFAQFVPPQCNVCFQEEVVSMHMWVGMGHPKVD